MHRRRRRTPNMHEISSKAAPRLGHRTDLAFGLLLATTVVLYSFGLGRGFVSEDFIILRRLSEGGFFETARAQLTGPWLDVTFFRFYRPIGTLVLQLEWMLFGIRPIGYLLIHVAAHGLAILLLFRLVCRLLGRRGLAVAACVPFALYPLGPNTVLFIASFATLFSTLAFLGAIVFFLRWRDGQRHGGAASGQQAWRAGLGSLVLGALAMGTYEGAVVLPAVLLALDLLLPASPSEPGIGQRARWGFHLVGWGALGLYFALRRVALGTVVGGYPDLAAIFSGERVHELLVRLQVDVSRLVLPTWGAWHPRPLSALIDAMVLLVSLLALLRWRGRAARLWWLGLVWIWLTQLPFGVVSVVPANGRYWYLPSVGLAFWLGAALLAVGDSVQRRLAIALGSIALLGYGSLLTISVHGHAAAGREAERFRQALSAHARALPPGTPVIVHDEPDFARQGRGPFARAPLAQVFHWGLADALMPPFEARDLLVYPLPRFPVGELGPMLDLGDRSASWIARVDDGWRSLAPSADGASTMTVSRTLSENAEPALGYRASGVPDGCRVRAVIVARGHPDLTPWIQPRADGTVAGSLPVDTVTTMLRLYPGPIFWWLEARDTAGVVQAQSALQRVER